MIREGREREKTPGSLVGNLLEIGDCDWERKREREVWRKKGNESFTFRLLQEEEKRGEKGDNYIYKSNINHSRGLSCRVSSLLLFCCLCCQSEDGIEWENSICGKSHQTFSFSSFLEDEIQKVFPSVLCLIPEWEDPGEGIISQAHHVHH